MAKRPRKGEQPPAGGEEQSPPQHPVEHPRQLRPNGNRYADRALTSRRFPGYDKK